MSSRQYAQRVMKNGIAAMIVALFGGFALAFAMLQGISLSPLPVFIDYTIPGSERGWRIFHVGMLMNGIMAVALGAMLRWLVVSGGSAAVASWGIIIAVWGNFMFYLFAMFADNKGLTLGANRLGEASIAGALAFAPAIVGAVTLMVALIIMIRAAFSD